MDTMTPEMQTLKSRLKATWEAGDYARFAQEIEIGAAEFLSRLSIPVGTKVLDIGCGAGKTAIPMAQAGAIVTGVDIASNLVHAARLRAAEVGVEVRFDEGDAEQLPYPSQSFDLVVSLIGAMFAPRPDRVAAEMLRVCQPGGRIVMANWTPDGFVGQLFKTMAKHVPPSPLMPSPLLWGSESIVRERFGRGVVSIVAEKYHYPFHFKMPPAKVVEFFRTYFGPTNRAFAALDIDAQASLRSDLAELWTSHNQATDGTTKYTAEYLHFTAIRSDA
jgi:ubiquinone/menaquinone biosynthesis C-methylase UbiE